MSRRFQMAVALRVLQDNHGSTLAVHPLLFGSTQSDCAGAAYPPSAGARLLDQLTQRQEENVTVPNETWSERFEREFEAGLALLRRRPLLAIIFAGGLIFFAWHQFFKTKDLSPAAPPAAPPTATQKMLPPTSVGDVASATSESMAQPVAQAITPTPSQSPVSDTPPAISATTETATPPMTVRRLATVALTDYFDKPILIGDTRKDVLEKIPNATFGQRGPGIFASISTKFLDQFPGVATLFFSNDGVTQVNFLYGFSGSTMRNYRLHGTDDDWEEKITTNGEDMTYVEATAKCASFQHLRAELTRKFGAAKSIRDIPFIAPENDSRTRSYRQPVEDRFDATYTNAEVNLHIVAYDFAFIREQTHTIMAKDKLSHRSCSIRAEFTKNVKTIE
ncbi:MULTISPECIES: hypothetical protein [unclassified Janthinobacterium]|uniref:hypothetical protein n=1 Tax=unclassified Janthinobacterium TaxID=2610881 RepID=UPI0011130F5C|nr:MULTISPECIES: hypothetical protein [unclassified Janthinobacterium]